MEGAILQILRAQGFHAAKPSVIDTLTEVVANYLILLSSRTLAHALSNHGDSEPTITDARMAMVDCGLLAPTQTSSEEVWRELLRVPISQVNESNGLRTKERARRDKEDTEGIHEFLDWISGSAIKETKRVAGFTGDEVLGAAAPELLDLNENKEDYLTVMKKKHSKLGEESRFSGTVLGKEVDNRGPVIIEGGPATLREWQEMRIARSRLSTPVSSIDEPLAGRGLRSPEADMEIDDT